MDQVDQTFREIQQLLSDISDVRLSVGDSVTKDPRSVDDQTNDLTKEKINSRNNNSNGPSKNVNNRYQDNNDCNNNIENSHIYENISNSDVNVTISSASESESSEEECMDEMIEDSREQGSPQDNNSSLSTQPIDNNNNNKNFDDKNNSNKPLFSHTSQKPTFCSNNTKSSPGRSNSNTHHAVTSVASKPNSSVNAYLYYVVSESNDTDVNLKVEPYSSVSDGNTSGCLYSTTGETYPMSDDDTINEEDKSDQMSQTSADHMIKRSLVSNPPTKACCGCCGGCCGECIFRISACLWFLISSILFILDISSDLCLAVHYTFRLHHVWASLTFIPFFLPWVYNIYSFYKFQRCKRNVWERWCGSLLLLLGLYPVFRGLVALLDNLYARRNNQKRRNPSDPENNSTSAAEIFMMTVLLQDIPQLFLQVFIVGRRNMIDAPAMFSIVTSFLCIVITISSGFAAITQGQYEWMSDNVEMFLLQPCQEKILQSRILKDEWKDFYDNSPTFDPLLLEVERSKDKLKKKMAACMANTKGTFLPHESKYYTTTFPLYVLMTSSFVPSLSFFASLEEEKFPWMALVVYFMVHLYVTWSLLCCRGAIYFPIHKLRRPLINYTACKCTCRACIMRFSFVLQIVFLLFANAFVSVWCSSAAHFVAQTSNPSTLQCVPSYIWPNTLPVLKILQVVLVSNNTTNSTEWSSCQVSYASSERSDNIFDLAIHWILTFQICISDHVTIVYWFVTVSSALLLVYHFLLVCQPRVEVSLDQQTQLWRRIFDERKNLWDKIGEEQETIKAWDRAKASKTIQRNEVWCTTVNKCVYGKWKKKATSL